jgi:hypothetical protein
MIISLNVTCSHHDIHVADNLFIWHFTTITHSLYIYWYFSLMALVLRTSLLRMQNSTLILEKHTTLLSSLENKKW